jgi:hypothetical protein
MMNKGRDIQTLNGREKNQVMGTVQKLKMELKSFLCTQKLGCRLLLGNPISRKNIKQQARGDVQTLNWREQN